MFVRVCWPVCVCGGGGSWGVGVVVGGCMRVCVYACVWCVGGGWWVVGGG